MTSTTLGFKYKLLTKTYLLLILKKYVGNLIERFLFKKCLHLTIDSVQKMADSEQ